MKKESVTYCGTHQREKTGYSTLYCPDCVRESEAVRVDDSVVVIEWTIPLPGTGMFPPIDVKYRTNIKLHVVYDPVLTVDYAAYITWEEE